MKSVTWRDGYGRRDRPGELVVVVDSDRDDAQRPPPLPYAQRACAHPAPQRHHVPNQLSCTHARTQSKARSQAQQEKAKISVASV